jgi:hypothetical protein
MGWMNLKETDMRYLYCPFNDDNVESLTDWAAYDSQEKRKPTQAVSAGRPQDVDKDYKYDLKEGYLKADLNDVPAHCPVYVIAHGDKGFESIGAQDRKTTMSAEELAQKLSVLKKEHKVIKLFLCNVGLDLLKGNEGFGYKFWKAMHDRGYDKLWVVCYLGVTIDSGYKMRKQMGEQASHKQVIRDAQFDPETRGLLSGTFDRASKWRIFIDPQGKIYEGANVPPLV